MKRYFVLFFLLPFCLITQKIDSTPNQTTIIRTVDTQQDVSKPIVFTQAGINAFFKDRFSSPAYARDFLPYSFKHLIQLLEHGNEKDESKAYFQTMIRLFTNKVKAAPFITVEAFTTMINHLASLGQQYVTVEKNDSSNSIKKTITDLLYDKFLSHFALFKSETNLFLNTVSEHIVHIVNCNTPEQNNDSSVQQIRLCTILLLENCISKLIWNPRDQEKTWGSVKKVAHNISQLHAQQIIANPNNIEDLLTSLIERYCYFIELTHGDLSLEFFLKIQEDITNECPVFLKNNNQNLFIKTNLDRLMQALTVGEARARAQEYGLCANNYEKQPAKQRIETFPMPPQKKKRTKRSRRN